MARNGKVRVGLIGTGWIGQHHGQNVMANEHAELAAVYDCAESKAKTFLEKLGSQAVVHKQYEDLLKQEDVDAVVIASPNASHAEQAIAAAEAGKHIYLEKPMAITLEDCRKVAKTIARSGVKCDMGYHRRLSPLTQYAKTLLSDGKLGDLVLAESDYFHYIPGDWDIWAWAGKKNIAGTPIHGGTGHNIDLLRYFCGEVAEVECFRDIKMPRKIQVETEDIAIINLRFESGILGRVGLFLGPILPFTFTLRLFGTQGSVDNNRVWLNTIPRFYDFGFEQDCLRLPKSWIWDNVQGGVSETWKQSIDAFIEDVRLDRKPFNDAVSGFNTAAVCFSALQAAEQRRTVKPEKL
ncbi:MAG: Gfo/Idh/MocA family oxidoreductase [Spirochaetota bacterium]